MKKLFNVTYNHGLHKPIVVEAVSRDEAIKIGLAEYRKRCTHIYKFDAKFVVKDAEELN